MGSAFGSVSLVALLFSVLANGCSGSGSDAVAPSDAGIAEVDGSPATTGDGGVAACNVAPVTITHVGAATKPAPVLHTVDLAKAPLAVCNDGTPAIYAVRPGYGGGAKRWLISLEGGGSCGNASDCADRRNATTQLGKVLTTSSLGMAKVNKGIVSDDPTENPDFYDANVVRVHYCSSDSWQGAHAAVGAFSASDPATWSFQGHAIVAGVVQELLGLGLSSAEELVLEGESAGGGGVFFSANPVAKMIPSTVRFVAIPDAAFSVNVPGFDESAPGGVSTAAAPYPNEVKQTEAQSIWQGYGDEACAKTHAAGDVACSSPRDLLDSGAYAMPFFVRQSLRDANKMGVLSAPAPDSAKGQTPIAQAYFAYYRDQQRAAMKLLPAPYSVFGSDTTDHIDLLGGEGGPSTFSQPPYTFATGENLTIAQAIHTFYENPCQTHHWIQ